MKKFAFFYLIFLFSCSGPGSEMADKPATVNFDANRKKVVVITTADSTGYRLTPTDTLQFSSFPQPLETQACIFIDPGHTFQEFLGIGGALTDASAETYAKLPAEKQEEFMRACYDPDRGIGYTLARTNIHSCDFSSDSYTYVEDNDSTLQTFSVKHDEKYRIPFIKKAIEEAGGRLTLFASPWSPPGWMKTNHEMLHGGKLLPRYDQAWANYYVKFIKAYSEEGIPVWGITVQNEPMATQSWESCIYTAQEERDFVKNYLGPTLAHSGMQDIKIIVHDHNRDLMFQRASTILDDPDAAKYVWGTGFHWYVRDAFENVKRLQEAFPDKKLLFTEGCADSFDWSKIHNWQYGEKYGISMVHDFNNGSVGWTDWNVLLDEIGGPNHVGNYCFAPIHADTRDGSLIFMNSYYYIGQFSKFIRPGAKRISASSNRDQLLTTAFVNKDGKIAVIVLNTTNEKIPYHLWVAGMGAESESLPHSIVTLLVENK